MPLGSGIVIMRDVCAQSTVCPTVKAKVYM